VTSISRQRPLLLVVLAELTLWARRDGLIRAAVRRGQQSWRAALVALFEEGKATAMWPAEFDAQAAQELVVAAAVSATLTQGGPRRIQTLERLLLPR
jgi:hypothetical protein